MSLASIVSIGTAVPSNKIAQTRHLDYVLNTYELDPTASTRLQKIYNSCGIDSRHTVLEDFLIENASTGQRMELYKEHALPLCLKAVRDCLEGLVDYDVKNISHLITFSCTGMYAPGLDVDLIKALQLGVHVERSCINFMGCYAAFNALKLAQHIVRSQPGANVLLAGVELCSLHNRFSKETDQLVANAIFGDGAAAVLVAGETNNNYEGKNVRLGLRHFYSEFQDASSDMAWTIGDKGFQLKLSSYVPKIIERGIAELVDKLMNGINSETKGDLLYAIHPGGTAVLHACEKALNINANDNAHSYSVLRRFGNMSSVTVLFVLKEYLAALKPSDNGKTLLSCGFGPGITIESMLLQVLS
jgi:alpha-pyrone synthase